MKTTNLPIRRLSCLCLGATLLATKVNAQDESFLPERYSVARYENIAQGNPFVMTIDEVKTDPEEPSNWAIAYVKKQDGKWVLGIVNTDKNADPAKKFGRVVEGEKPATDGPAAGIKFVSLVTDPKSKLPARDPKKVEAKIEVGGRTETIRYDEKRLKAKPKPVSKKPGIGRTPTGSRSKSGSTNRVFRRTGSTPRGSGSSKTKPRVVLPPGVKK